MYTYEKRVGVNLIPPMGPGLGGLGVEARWCEEEPASGRQKRPVGVNLNSAAQAAQAGVFLKWAQTRASAHLSMLTWAQHISEVGANSSERPLEHVGMGANSSERPVQKTKF